MFLKSVFLVFFSLIINSAFAANFFNPPGEPSGSFDGEYTFSHICYGKSGPEGDKYDGSSFIIKNGIVTNNKAGAGRYVLKDESRIDKNGKIIIKGTRKDSNFSILGKFSENFKNKEIILKGKMNGKKWQLSKGRTCKITFKRTGDVKKRVKLENKVKFLEIEFSSKNTNDEIQLLNDEGESLKIKAKIRNIKNLNKGIIIVVPSSNANMDDEEIYEYKVSDFGLATAIIYGADPRYSSKFSGSYTSSMIMYDVIALIKDLQENYKDPKEVILMGSSTGSLAIFKAAWSDYLDKYPSISKISKVFMINAACPDTFDATLRGDIEIFAINGKEDDSTPGWVCKNLKVSKNYKNIHLLQYEGAHHFESNYYPPTKFIKNGMHALPTCSINYKTNLYSVVKVRNSSTFYDTETGGFGKDQKNWFGKNCVKKGNYQGYEKKGADNFWTDVKSVILNDTKPEELIGFTN